jgi:hypothetical protein
MTRPGVSLILVCALWTLAPVRADEPRRPRENPAIQELKAVRDDLVGAIKANERDRILKHLHPNVVVTWLDGHVTHSAKEFMEYYDTVMSGPDKKVEKIEKLDPVVTAESLSNLYGQSGAIPGSDFTTPAVTAVVYGHSNDRFVLRGGSVFDAQTHWTATLVKEEGQWRVASFQTSVSPFENPIQSRTANIQLYIAAGVGAVVGVLLGFLVGRFSMRRLPPSLPPPAPLSRPFP